jgi:hypothetical protein
MSPEDEDMRIRGLRATCQDQYQFDIATRALETGDPALRREALAEWEEKFDITSAPRWTGLEPRIAAIYAERRAERKSGRSIRDGRWHAAIQAEAAHRHARKFLDAAFTDRLDDAIALWKRAVDRTAPILADALRWLTPAQHALGAAEGRWPA